jgi:hypothetical protein
MQYTLIPGLNLSFVFGGALAGAINLALRPVCEKATTQEVTSPVD